MSRKSKQLKQLKQKNRWQYFSKSCFTLMCFSAQIVALTISTVSLYQLQIQPMQLTQQTFWHYFKTGCFTLRVFLGL